MKIAIIGLGYVGITSAAGLLALGHTVIGYEKNPVKVKTLQNGSFPIIEPKISKLFKTYKDNFETKIDLDISINDCDCIMVAVGTPTSDSGQTNMAAMDNVLISLSEIIKTEVPIILRSTIPIGSSRKYSNAYSNLNIVFHPEFLREGSAVDDFFNPPKIVYGLNDSSVLDSHKILNEIYPNFDASIFYVEYESAESVKYADNIFHALKVSFTNEIVKAVSKKGANPDDVMNIFRSDTHLNISPVYLRPGFAYGGSCLEKDLYSFRNQNHDCDLPLLEAITQSNQNIIVEFYKKIASLSKKFVINGLTFKEGIDDLRRSPFVYLVNLILEQKGTVYAYDDNLENVFGESLDILNNLSKNPNFHLNKIIEESKDEVLVIFSHKEKHSSLDISYVSDFDLFVGGNITKVYK